LDWLFSIPFFKDYFRPFLDILFLAFILYKGYQILVQTRAIQLIKGAFTLALIYFLAFIFQLNTLLWVLNLFGPGIVIGAAIIFQPELRKIFTHLGQKDWFKFNSNVHPYHFESVLNAVEVLADNKKGCLLVVTRKIGLKNIIDTGTRLDAELSSSLILTIFSTEAPLHDGAIIIEGGRIVAAGCFLPLSEQLDIRKSFGTRHRAALGLVEETDAVVIVVSEETGTISLAYNANLLYDLTLDELSSQLSDIFEYSNRKEEENAFEA
jgi:diadenylate cyclase